MHTATIGPREKSAVRILHVDDDPSFLEVAKEILESECNYAIDWALSAEEALKKIREQDYAVIISDYQMPEKNGLDLLKELCLQGISTPFILFTGKGNKEIESEMLNLGAFRYFNKNGKSKDVFSELSSYIDEIIKDSQVNARPEKKAVKEVEIDAFPIEQRENAFAIASQDANVTLAVLPFNSLRYLCRFEKDYYCRATKKCCNLQNCPQVKQKSQVLRPCSR